MDSIIFDILLFVLFLSLARVLTQKNHKPNSTMESSKRQCLDVDGDKQDSTVVPIDGSATQQESVVAPTDTQVDGNDVKQELVVAPTDTPVNDNQPQQDPPIAPKNTPVEAETSNTENGSAEMPDGQGTKNLADVGADANEKIGNHENAARVDASQPDDDKVETDENKGGEVETGTEKN